jgi:hypothetical protein
VLRMLLKKGMVSSARGPPSGVPGGHNSHVFYLAVRVGLRRALFRLFLLLVVFLALLLFSTTRRLILS